VRSATPACPPPRSSRPNGPPNAAPNPDSTYQDSSVRRVTTQEYLEAIDWTDINQVSRALRVFERLIQVTSKLLNSLRRDGYTVDEETGHIASGGPRFAPSSPQNITDASAIRQQLTRVQHAVLDDPALAVGSAEELIESTAKAVLKERGQPVDDKDDLPALVRNAQRAPGLPRPPRHPARTAAARGSVSGIAIGLAELRNRGYGTGHGSATAPVGLGPRHAHLAVDAAFTWCQLMLDTLADPKTPGARN
jgi:hypothetical protein